MDRPHMSSPESWYVKTGLAKTGLARLLAMAMPINQISLP